MAAPSAALPLRGRTRELAQLDEILAQVAGGQWAAALVEGEAGIGKSSVLERALQGARAAGVSVHTGRAAELERSRPFGVLGDALGCARSDTDPHRAAIAELLSTRSGERGPITVSSDAGLRFQAVDAFVDLIEALATDGPVVIGLDDLHWADPSSLLTIGALARRLTHLPVGLICCLRPAPHGDQLVSALAELDAAGARHVRLGQLDDPAVSDIVADHLTARPGDRLMAAVGAAGGNPLFVTELLAALGDEGAITTVDGYAEVIEASLPPDLRLTILRRLSFLSDRALDALRCAAVLGSTFSITDLATTTGRTVLDLAAALRPAFESQVLADDADQLRFRHSLIRDAIYDDLPDGVRSGLHREAGHRLAAANAPALQVAGHLARGAAAGDGEAIGWLARAAREVSCCSPATAADLLRQAIELSGRNDGGRDQLLAERAVSLLWDGRLEHAETICRELLWRHHDTQMGASVRACLAHVLIAQGRVAEALHELERVCRSTQISDTERARAWGWAGVARLSVDDLDAAAEAAEAALTAADAAGDHFATSLALCCRAVVDSARGRLTSALSDAEHAVQLADRSPQQTGHLYPVRLFQGMIMLEADRFREAAAALETGRRISEQFGVRRALPCTQIYHGVGRFLAGDWDDAIAALETGLQLAQEDGERYSVIHARNVLCLIALHRGDLHGAEAMLAAAGAELDARGPRLRHHWLDWVRALLLDSHGHTEEAYATLQGCWQRCEQAGLTIELPVLGTDLVRLALATGHAQRAAHVADTVDELAAGQDVDSLRAAAAHCRGLVAGDPDMLLRAAAHYERAARPLQAALATEDAAAALADDPDGRSRAVALLEQALAAFERLGAARDLARVEARLRELGVRHGRRGTRRRPASGWESLTPTERTIVGLVAEGLSNPQVGERLFVSRRTVQTHLAHVFSKLGISSRAQLAAHAVRHQAQPHSGPR